MTIAEAIKFIMKRERRPLTSAEIYQKIVELNLYSFGAKNPKAIVNGTIRRHSLGIDFPTANPVKYFKVHSKEGNVTKYLLKEDDERIDVNMNEQVNAVDFLPEEKILKAYLEHKELIKQALLDK